MTGMLEFPQLHEPAATIVAEQLEQVSCLFERQLASDLSPINGLCLHIERYRGKMLRPSLVLLTGLAAGGEPVDGCVLNDRHRTVAAVTEMIHMATLVHDDVLDEAEVRRRGATVNYLWGNEVAVMLGDYLISNAFHLCSSLNDPAVNYALGSVTNALCSGELLQLHHRDNYSIDEETYFEIIRLKTASLIGECCRLGAVMSLAPAELAEAVKRFGLALGVAFQIQDDLLDLIGDQSVVGKSLGRDLEKGKLTLPLIHYMTTVDQADRGKMLRLIETRDARAIRLRLLEGGSVQYAQDAAARLVDDAKCEIDAFPTSTARDLLYTLADAVVSRSH